MTPNDEPRSYARPIESLARAFVRARNANLVASDEHWPREVERYRELCRKYPNYVDAYSLITDAFRDAEIAWAEIKSHGWITPGGLDAMNAELSAKGAGE